MIEGVRELNEGMREGILDTLRGCQKGRLGKLTPHMIKCKKNIPICIHIFYIYLCTSGSKGRTEDRATRRNHKLSQRVGQ